MKNISYFLVLLIVIFIITCGEENSVTPISEEAEQLVQDGWETFGYGVLGGGSRTYENALNHFLSAIDIDSTYAAAYTGAGWSSARLNQLTNAISYFTKSVSFNSAEIDAHAGMAFVLNAQKNYSDSNAAAEEALQLNAAWLFVYDQSVSHADLHLILAENYFALGNFSSSLAEVKVLNPSFDANISTFEGKSTLAEEIERLRGIV